MTTEMIDLKRSMTVKDAFDLIRKVGTDMETIYTCYVTDEQRVLEGVVTVRDLLLHPYEAKVGDLMDEDPLSVQTGDDQETIAQMFQKYDILTLPVVDSENVWSVLSPSMTRSTSSRKRTPRISKRWRLSCPVTNRI